MNSIGLAWLESTGMLTALLQCVTHACFLSTHWMNGLLNMVNDSYSNPRLVDSYIHMESEKDHRAKHSDKSPPSISCFLFKFTRFVMLKVLVMQFDPEIWGRRCLFPQRLFPSYENPRSSTCCYQQALMRTERWLSALGRATLPSILILGAFRSERKS